MASAQHTASAATVELPVDFQLVGLARRFSVPVTAAERAALRVGSRVTLIGDAVEPLEATVLSLCDDEADVEINET